MTYIVGVEEDHKWLTILFVLHLIMLLIPL